MGTQPQLRPDRPIERAMETNILEWTRRVRAVLTESGSMPLASLARRITDASTNEVAMAVGWLAHAGEIRFARRGALWEIALLERHGLVTGNKNKEQVA